MSILWDSILSDRSAEVFDLLPLGICVFDRDLTISFWNRTLADWTDISACDIVGQRLSDRYPMLDTPRFNSRLKQVFETLSPVILSPALHKHLIPVRIQGDDQRMMVQRVTLRPYDREGTLVLAVIEDVSVMHRQLDQLRCEKLALVEANEKVQNYATLLGKSNEELEQFAYVASHDLQEPLRKISSYCQLLTEEQEDRLDEEGRDYLCVVIGAADRLRQLVQDLLAFSRVTTHGKSLAPIDAQACLGVATDNLEIAIKESGARITHDPLPVVLAEEDQLTQLFQNLVGNAIKYRGDNSPVVHIGVSEDPGVYEFFVSDNGIGIAPHFQERVFKVFRRLHNRRDYDGTGIGLAICKRIVERFGGQIRIESELGSGCTFYFTVNKPTHTSPTR